MKNKLLLIWFVCAFTALNISAKELEPSRQQSQAALVSAEVLTRYHYKRVPLDDAMSKKIFDRYLKTLDGEKIFFLQSDIDHFKSARTKLDDAILKQNLHIPFAIFDVYQRRITERINYARSLLKKDFDFKKHESYQYNRKNAPWMTSQVQMKDLWRKRVKNDWLRLKLAGKGEASIVNTLGKRYDSYLNSVSKLKSEDVFQDFMNAYTLSIDPHSNYLGVRASEDFNISMSLSLVGIGAVLQTKDEYTTIRELVPGGPAALSDQLKSGDRIVGVGQGDAAVVDVMGWRIGDTVALIRGTEDTVVRLDILPAEGGPDAKHKLVTLTRKKITLAKQAATKSIVKVKDGAATRRVGVISLPGFYQDFAARQRGDKNFKSATRDVARLLKALKKEKVDSVLIDLRNNGGGSLDEAVELTGLFIDQGPVVQQRDSKGEIIVESDTNAGLAWSGPMGVLINHGSASASEIFAAAIQDYGRGVVIGGTSFGKGTVQSVINLDRLAKKRKPEFGELKMTIAQFFRINGGTTQLRGVIPDISLPMMADAENFGESSYKNALPWAHIKPADYKPAGVLKDILPMLMVRHDMRVAGNQNFKYLRQDIVRFNKQRKKNLISLNESDRIKERKAQERRIKLREKNRLTDKHMTASDAVLNAALQDDGLQSNERNLKTDLAIEKAKKNVKDVLLNEAAHILSDEVGLLKGNSQLAASVLPRVTVR